MSPELANALPYILIGLVLIAVAIWLLLRANRTARVIDESGAPKTRDVLDEGAERARRNQALIDAPRSVEQTIGTTSAAANSDHVAAAGALADAEAGPAVKPMASASAPAPAPAPAPTPTPASPANADDLTQMKGVGPKLAAMLAEQGITRFAEIAAWSEADVERIDATLGRFKGRIERDQWIEQARLLSAGDPAAFAEKFGRNG